MDLSLMNSMFCLFVVSLHISFSFLKQQAFQVFAAQLTMMLTFIRRVRALMDLCVPRRTVFDVVSRAYTARVRQHLERFIHLSHRMVPAGRSVSTSVASVWSTWLKTLSVSVMDVLDPPQILWKRLMAWSTAWTWCWTASEAPYRKQGYLCFRRPPPRPFMASRSLGDKAGRTWIRLKATQKHVECSGDDLCSNVFVFFEGCWCFRVSCLNNSR